MEYEKKGIYIYIHIHNLQNINYIDSRYYIGKLLKRWEYQTT